MDEASVRELYNSLDPHIKENAKIILLPVATATGTVYAMDNETGEPVSFDFARASSATHFSSDRHIGEAGINVPRIDYGNYSDNTKLLIEKASTNLLVDSMLNLGLSESGISTSSKIDINWYNFFSKAASLHKPAEAPNYSYLYKNVTYSNDGYYIASFFTRTPTGVAPKITSVYNTSDVKVSVRNGGSTNQTLYDSVDGTTFRVSGIANVVDTPNTGGAGAAKRYDNLEGDIYVTGYQLETGTGISSYIPTSESTVTRSADLLKYTLNKPVKAMIKTVNNGVIELELPIGEWNIHDDIPTSDGIEYIVLLDTEATLENTFIPLVKADGGIVDENALSEAYNALTDEEKDSDAVIIPGAYTDGFVYGINKDFSFVKLPFGRSSSATLFDKDMNLVVTESNMPRIDYGNYSQDVKLLIEKNATNSLIFNGIIAQNGTLTRVAEKYENARLYRESDTNTYHRVAINLEAVGTEISKLAVSALVRYDGTRKYAIMRLTGTTNNMGTIDLENKLITNTIAGLNIKVENLGNDWMRILANVDNPNSEALVFWLTSSLIPDSTSAVPAFEGDPTQGFVYALAQAEKESDGNTSIIPTTTSAVTRSADLLSYDLARDCTVYLKTTKQEITLNKLAGIWNIHEDLNNEGIISILIKNN